MTPRRACAVDSNQAEVADAFRRLGWDVIDTHACAQYVPGWPDLVAIWYRGWLHPPLVLGIEVKAPRGRLTKKERLFAALHPEWAPVIVRTADDVLRLTEEG